MYGLILLGIMGGFAYNIPTYAKDFRGGSSAVNNALQFGSMLLVPYYLMHIWAFIACTWWWVLIEFVFVSLFMAVFLRLCMCRLWTGVAGVVSIILGLVAFMASAVCFYYGL